MSVLMFVISNGFSVLSIVYMPSGLGAVVGAISPIWVVLFSFLLFKKVKFKAFSVKQHKDLVKSLLDGVEGTVSMYKVFNDIVFDNSTEDVDFTLYDRNKILVDLRKQCVSEIIKVEDREYNLNSLPEYTFDFELTKQFSYKGISVSASVPSLREDSKITEKSIVEFNKIGSDDKKVGDSLNILLIYVYLYRLNKYEDY